MRVSLPTPQRAWLAISLAGFFLGVTASIALPHSYSLTAAGDLIQSFLLLSLLAVSVTNTRASRHQVRMFWLLMSVSISLWLSAQLWWTYFEVVLRKDVPNPFVGDIAIVLHLVPMVAALAVRADQEGQRSQRRSLDFVLLFGWWLYLYLFFVIPWQYVSLDAHIYGVSFDVLYFAGHAVVLLAATDAWRNSSGLWRAVYGRILIASVVYAAASIAASVAIDYGKYYTGSLYDIPLLLSVVLFIGMALLGSPASPMVNFASEPARPPRPRVTALTILAASSLPVLAAWAIFFSDAPDPVQQYRLGLTLAMIVFVGTLRSIKQYRVDKELARVNEELREASVTDVLTGVRNRRFLTATIEKDTQQALRFYSTDDNSNRNRDLVFYLIDLDHFKLVNDRFGHQQGDALLVQVAARISSAIRHSDVLIRWGGEEFLVVSRFSDRDNAEILAKRILLAIGSEAFKLSSGSIGRTCSIGWAIFPWSREDPEAVPYQDVLRLADQALYKAKNAGRNTAIGILPGAAGPHSSDIDSLADDFSVNLVATQGP